MEKKARKPVVYSALEVANICGVVNQTAINWIRGNHLKAFKTPGGQFRVYPDDLVEFMQNRKMVVPQELLDECSKKFNDIVSVLIVDDDESLNGVIARFIEKYIDNVKIFQAFDGFDAGSKMVENKPKIVLLDLDLPGVDGFDLCRRIKESDLFGKPSVIVVTALQDAEAEKRCRSLGVTNFFQKPVNFLELLNAVKECC